MKTAPHSATLASLRLAASGLLGTRTLDTAGPTEGKKKEKHTTKHFPKLAEFTSQQLVCVCVRVFCFFFLLFFYVFDPS